MKAPLWWHRRGARRPVLGLAALIVLSVAGLYAAQWRASWVITQLLGDWATGTVADESGGVYQLHPGKITFTWARRRVSLDSISLNTLRAVNDDRAHPLPGLHVTLYNCRISGVRFFSLIRRGGLVAGTFGCHSGSLLIEVPAARPVAGAEPDGPSFSERQPLLDVQRGVRLPPYAHRLHIARVAFPQLALEVRLPRREGGATRLQLERLRWSMTDVIIDPGDSAAASRPMFSRKIELFARTFITHTDRGTAVSVGLLRSSLTDSTLEIRGIAWTPNPRGADPQGPRRTLVRIAAGRVAVVGLDVGAFVGGAGVRARRIVVDSFRLGVTTDDRVPHGPRTARRTPQQWIADLDETLTLDSLLVHDGAVLYSKRAAGRDAPGVIGITRIEVAAANVRHIAGRHTAGDPMTLTASARLLGAGQVNLQALVPLDAPRFDLSLSGSIGAMPAAAFNPFLMATRPMRISSGEVTGATVRLTVRGGVATGTVTPRFTDLAVAATREGADGILGSGGLLGGAARGLWGIAASTKVRADNPGRPGGAPRSGTIRRVFTTDQTLPSFVWSGVRDAMMTVVRR